MEAGWIVFWWILFTGSHLALASTRVEPGLKQRLGEGGFLGLYSLISFATFIPLCVVYFDHRHGGELLWHVPVGPVLRIVLYVGMGIGVLLMASAFFQPSIASLVPGGDPAVRGAFRITRSPLVLGSAWLMALHLIPNGFATDVAFFGGFVVFALLGAWHQDRRKLAYETPGFEEFHEKTAFLPFARGGASGLLELGAMTWIVAGLLFFGLRWLHPLPLWPH